jgi:hypothetical protein
MKKLLLTLFLTCLALNVNAADKQFICTFTSSIKVTELSSTAPKAETRTINTRYTFLLSPDGSASYINLEHGNKAPATAIVEKYKTVFIERVNEGDNLFTVTIFNEQNPDKTYPAIYSFAAWKKIETYYPHMDFGTCRKVW